MPRPIFTLAEQFIGWRADKQKLVVIQRWIGFSHRRHAFVISINDSATAQRADFPTNVDRSFNDAKHELLRYVVTEEQARDRLAEMGLPRERLCKECDHRLPLGALYCTNCGLQWGGHNLVTIPAAPPPGVLLVPASSD